MVLLSVHNSADIYGASRCLERTLRLFVEDGHTVHAVLPHAGPLQRLLEADGVRVHLLPQLAIIDRSQLSTSAGKLLFPFRFLLSTAQLVALILRHRVEVVHTNVAVLPAAPLAARLTGRRSVWHLREFFSEFGSLWRFYQHYMGAASSRILTISHAVEQQFTPELRRKCTTVYDGLDPEAERSHPEAVQAFRTLAGNPQQLVGVVGRIKWVRKGQEVLVEAAALLRERFPGVRYMIVGSVSAGNEDHLLRLEQLIQARGLEGSFIFTGDVADTRDVYKAFDITVVPSIQAEPFGLVVMESMAVGTPVIGSRCGGIPEQVADGETGFLFEPGNGPELAHALATLLEDQELRRSMGLAGQRRFREHFAMRQTYERTAECFGVPAKPRAPSPVAL